jgi:HSP20 family protein
MASERLLPYSRAAIRRLSMTMVRRPIGEYVPLRDVFDRLFDESFFRPLRFTADSKEYMALADLYTTPDEVILKMALPGIKPEDVSIEVTEELVTISGKYVEEIEKKETGYHLRELGKGTFLRTLTLPVPVKSAEAQATFKDGLLTLRLPKTQAVKPIHVPISAS